MVSLTDLFVAIGLVFAIEGILYALFPEAMLRMLKSMKDADPTMLRTGGIVALGLGVLVVWLARG